MWHPLKYHATFTISAIYGWVQRYCNLWGLMFSLKSSSCSHSFIRALEKHKQNQGASEILFTFTFTGEEENTNTNTALHTHGPYLVNIKHREFCLWSPQMLHVRAVSHHGLQSRTMKDGLFSWSDLSKNQFTKSLGLSLGVNWMWTKRNDHAPKIERVVFKKICLKMAV